MLLISLNAYAKDKLLKELPNEEEEKVPVNVQDTGK
jgi:hypothetical protein